MTTHEDNQTPYGGPYPWRPQRSDPDPDLMGPATREHYAREDWRLAQIADATTKRQLAQATPPGGTPRDGIRVPPRARPTTPHDPGMHHPHRGTYHPPLEGFQVVDVAWTNPVKEWRIGPWRCQAPGCPECWFPGMWPIKVPFIGYFHYERGAGELRETRMHTVFACKPDHGIWIERNTRKLTWIDLIRSGIIAPFRRRHTER